MEIKILEEDFTRDEGHEGGLFEGGPIFVNIQNPLAPVMEGGFSDTGYCHDAQAVVYNGPDDEHLGKEIIIGSNAQHVDIMDVTDKANPILISTIVYENTHYTHQGWLTEDHKYFIVGDELDEAADGINTRSIVLDLTTWIIHNYIMIITVQHWQLIIMVTLLGTDFI
ncbi:MAG: hypothetical protein CM15mP36_16070 [Flavobacteriales bacterium]|nr:MAG: hypothetical protein CM15mP36_16070 [Flavobacteriales bacterium]